ncbi:hypothetical protein OG756_30230 [Streptomyces sp. NBC_01310]|uniref:hypothetical protein n=1 Tax=Streptomyces sp. NBC_01310 TaxID=2903820 RepID=UPI0035B62645|nr:hypothetical protein OG756_30230 [Streptomyces sp. NBC_01310]
MSDSLPAGDDTPTATHTTRTRRMAEVAAVVSAATALAALRADEVLCVVHRMDLVLALDAARKRANGGDGWPLPAS